MFVVNSYSLAVIFCFITMLCWGSWGNTQKLAGKTWRYELFYWDYVIGMVLFAILLGFTMGSIGTEGRPFLEDLAQAEWGGIGSVVLGGVIFNAVNNWPTETVAAAAQDAVYIEVWPPHDTYFDLYRLIREARLLSHRNVILAAYLKAFQGEDMGAAERSFRLAWAVISASGGTQLVLGENRSLLRDSYYVYYAHLRESFLPIVQRNCDFLVRYKDLLYNDPGMDIGKTASGGINEDVRFFSDACTFSTDGQADTVWTLLRESRDRLTLHLINLTGNNAMWNEGKREPTPAAGISAAIRLDRPVRGIYCASPDSECLAAQKLPYTAEQTENGCIYTVKLPDVRCWTAVWVQLEE